MKSSSPFLKILFIGSSDFGLPSLEKIHLHASYQLVGIITLFDKPSQRGKKPVPSAVKKWALEKNLQVPIFEPKNLKDPEFLEKIQKLEADLSIVIAFRMLPKELWSLPRLGTFNLHGSLLPNYRGSAPIHHALINGEKQTGVTTFLIDEKIDTGKMILQKATDIPSDENLGALYGRLSKLGASLVIDSIEAISKPDFRPISQSLKGDFREAPKLTSDFLRLNLDDSLKAIYNKIRGLSPYPGAWSEIFFDKKTSLRIKIFSCKIIPAFHNYERGKIVFDFERFEMKIALNKGFLSIEEAQLEGKPKRNAKELINGFRNKIPTHFSCLSL